MTDTYGLREVKFDHLGVTLKIRRIPRMLIEDWRKSLPAQPPVPTQEIDYGGGQKRLEENPTHPSYLQAIEAYNYDVGMRAIAFSIDRGVVVDVDQAAVTELRTWAAASGIQLPASDLVVFVSRILLPDLEDLVKLRQAVFGRTEATEEAIDQAVDRFPAKVPRG